MEITTSPSQETQTGFSFLPPFFDAQSYLKFGWDPFDTQSILNLQKALVTAPNRADMIQWLTKAVSEDAGFMQLFQELYNPRFPTNEELIQYPTGSFAQVLGAHLIKNGITLDFAGLDTSMFLNQDVNVLSYFSMRALRLHDVVHVILGLGVTPLEEYAVASFTLGQYHSPYHTLLVSAGAIYTVFHRPDQLREYQEMTNRFYELGKNSVFVTGFRFEEHLSTPISEVRALLGLPQDLAISN